MNTRTNTKKIRRTKSVKPVAKSISQPKPVVKQQSKKMAFLTILAIVIMMAFSMEPEMLTRYSVFGLFIVVFSNLI